MGGSEIGCEGGVVGSEIGVEGCRDPLRDKEILIAPLCYILAAAVSPLIDPVFPCGSASVLQSLTCLPLHHRLRLSVRVVCWLVTPALTPKLDAESLNLNPDTPHPKVLACCQAAGSHRVWQKTLDMVGGVLVCYDGQHQLLGTFFGWLGFSLSTECGSPLVVLRTVLALGLCVACYFRYCGGRIGQSGALLMGTWVVVMARPVLGVMGMCGGTVHQLLLLLVARLAHETTTIYHVRCFCRVSRVVVVVVEFAAALT